MSLSYGFSQYENEQYEILRNFGLCKDKTVLLANSDKKVKGKKSKNLFKDIDRIKEMLNRKAKKDEIKRRKKEELL